VGDEILNKYTPPSIFQELAWTKSIRDRDGIVTDEDIAPLLLNLGDGKVVDMQHRLTNQFGQDRPEALAQRRELYQLFEQAFDSETIIITLGLIECWLDRKTQQYVEFSPLLHKHNEKGRFAFKRLTFQEAYNYTRKALELLGARNILITTSPVPLARTFTSDDVIVANTYSKSVLRAVAGQIAEEFANVDYLPTYESVMLTKQTYVWSNDLTHVEGAFVGRIVARMCEHYASESFLKVPALDQWLSFANLVEHRRFDEAKLVLSQLNLDEPGIAARFVLPLAEMHLHIGDAAQAADLAERARVTASAAGERGCFDLLRCARIFEAAGDKKAAEDVRAAAVSALGNPGLIMSLLRRLPAAGEMDDTQKIITHIETRLSSNLDLLSFAILTLETNGDYVSATRTCRAAIRAHPNNANLLARMATLQQRQGKGKRALEFLERAHALDTKNAGYLKKLIEAYLEGRNLDRAEQSARALIALAPEDSYGYLQLASTYRRMGRKAEALENAQRAANLDPSSERYQNYVRELMGATAKR
jgi:tetratricopeptide (TPR) repeat protein